MAVISGSSARIADILLDIKAVHVTPETPFTFTSGMISPVYIDCRKIISFLNERREIINFAAELIRRECDMPKIDFIAGGETAGISYAAWLSEALDKPMLYVRKKPKGFGRGAQIEGEMPEGAHVLLVEDLTTDGGSKIAFAHALRDGGAVVSHVFSVFYYGIYKESEKMMADAGLKLLSLATWQDVLAAVKRRGVLSAEGIGEVEKFLSAPIEWSKAHGGPDAPREKSA